MGLNYIVVKVLGLPEGDVHISDATNWGVSKALIKEITIRTNSTRWNLWILQNDNGYAANDAAIPAMQLMAFGRGEESITVDLPYEDEDATDEVHLYFQDVTGSNAFDIAIEGYELL